jgi:hypothetical protein
MRLLLKSACYRHLSWNLAVNLRKVLLVNCSRKFNFVLLSLCIVGQQPANQELKLRIVLEKDSFVLRKPLSSELN